MTYRQESPTPAEQVQLRRSQQKTVEEIVSGHEARNASLHPRPLSSLPGGISGYLSPQAGEKGGQTNGGIGGRRKKVRPILVTN